MESTYRSKVNVRFALSFSLAILIAVIGLQFHVLYDKIQLHFHAADSIGLIHSHEHNHDSPHSHDREDSDQTAHHDFHEYLFSLSKHRGDFVYHASLDRFSPVILIVILSALIVPVYLASQSSRKLSRAGPVSLSLLLLSYSLIPCGPPRL